MIIVFRHHLHRCPGYDSGAIQKHPVHVWRCFRPNCDGNPVYLCGLMADYIATRREQALKNLEKGNEGRKKQRQQKYVS